MSLRIDSLHVRYGGVHALRGVSLDIEDGEAVALIGSNGAGKTSLLHAMTGMIPSCGGSVTFRGHNLTRMPSHAVTGFGIAHVPEGRRLFARMSVRENLTLGAYGRKHADLKKDFDAQLALFPRLEERLHQQAGTLSGGEQQMVAIARALMARPALLVLDEPSLGLSPLMIKTVFKAIAEVHKAGTSLLLVEQNAVKALELANRGYVISAGEVLTTGDSEDLRRDARVREIYFGAAS